MYFIASGQVELRTPELTRIYSTGEAFGVVALVNHDISHGSFRTLSRCRVLKLYREDFHRLEHSSPHLARAIRLIAQDRMRERELALLEQRQREARAVADRLPDANGDTGDNTGV